MKQYLTLLLDKKFGLLWLGATISTLGALLCSNLLTGYGVPVTILALAIIIAIPGMIGIVHPALSHENTVPVEA